MGKQTTIFAFKNFVGNKLSCAFFVMQILIAPTNFGLSIINFLSNLYKINP